MPGISDLTGLGAGMRDSGRSSICSSSALVGNRTREPSVLRGNILSTRTWKSQNSFMKPTKYWLYFLLGSC